jgi:hypothetical protein
MGDGLGRDWWMANAIGVGDASHKSFFSYFKQRRYFLFAKLAQSKI